MNNEYSSVLELPSTWIHNPDGKPVCHEIWRYKLRYGSLAEGLSKGKSFYFLQFTIILISTWLSNNRSITTVSTESLKVQKFNQDVSNLKVSKE